MDTSYAMAKFGLESKDILKSKQKGCWHYMKYFFFFSSIIQFLIILGLVLFMLYGNAHGGTELRLQSVENRYKNLTVDYARLKGNFSLLNEKLTNTEKALKNCSDNVTRLRIHIITSNKTCPKPPPPNCGHLQAILDHLNMTCINERLKAENYRMLQDIQFSQYKNNCNKSITDYANRDRLSNSENEQLKNYNKDLQSQLQVMKESCTTIDNRFRNEIENFRHLIEASLRPGDTYDYSTSKCKPFTDAINRIDFTLTKLRQDVSNVMYENSQLRVDRARITEDLGKCNQDKNIVTAERNKLVTEKSSVEKELSQKKDELNNSYSRYIRKEEELENCRKLQIRPMFPPNRP